MKIILLAPTPPPIGGIAMWTDRMLKAKLKNNWTIEIVDEKIIGNRDVYGNNTNRNYRDEIIRCFSIWKNLIQKLYDSEVSVVHSCIPAAPLSIVREIVCAIITKLYKRKFIVHFRCTVPNMVNNKLNKLLLKIICLLCDCIFVLNKQSEVYLKNLTKTKIKLIPNFVDINEIEDYHSINNSIKNVTYVGGVTKPKGCLALFDVAKRFPDIKFKFIGKYTNEFQKLSNEISNVLLLGSKNKDYIHEELKKTDVFLFVGNYKGEGFSNALAEAMACGVPCVVSDWAANKDMIENYGGIVVPPLDIDAIVSALNIMKDPLLRKKQSEFNIEKVKFNYCSSVVLDKYVDSYEELLDSNIRNGK